MALPCAIIPLESVSSGTPEVIQLALGLTERGNNANSARQAGSSIRTNLPSAS